LPLIAAFLFFTLQSSAQQRDLSFYQNTAHQNNSALKENTNLQQYTVLQNDFTLAQYRRPQVNFTADYLFAPFFFNNGQFISISPNPDGKAFGYNAGLTNGGWYAAQLNASVPLLTGKIINTYFNQNSVQNKLLKNENLKLIHELDKNISDQYITAYQIQQEVGYLQKIISVVTDRKKIVDALVQKGLMQQNDFLLLEIEINTRKYDIQQQKIALSNAFTQLNDLSSINDTAIYDLTAPVITQTQRLQQFNYQQKFQLDSLSVISQEEVFNTKYRPQISAYGNTGLNAVEAAYIPHSIGMSAGLHLYIPIYDGHLKKTVEQQNKLLMQNTQQYNLTTAIRIQNNLNNFQVQINLTSQSLSLLNNQLSTQETLLQILQDKVVIGQISVTDYLIAIQNYAETNKNKIQAQAGLLLLINQYNYVNW
jgi:hypothetical protein